MNKKITRNKHANIAWRQNNPALKGIDYLLFEKDVSSFMGQFSPNFLSGDWELYTLSNDSFYLALSKNEPVKLVNAMNDYEGEMSADAAGICLSIMALGCLSHTTKDMKILETACRKYTGLWDYAYQHKETKEMRRFLK